MPGIYLGTFEATVRDLTAAYTVLANGGVRRQAYLIERIDDANGETIYRAAHITRPAMDPWGGLDDDEHFNEGAGERHGGERAADGFYEAGGGENGDDE